jgi:tripartite-type tricarboxylate transporter receptor subunit TctC
VRDFAPITLAVRGASVLVVHPSIPANSTKEFIDYLKTSGAATSYGSSGNGSPSHLAAELFKSMAGVKAVHVPYKGVEGFNDLAAGRIQFFIGSVTSTMPVLKLGKVKALASTGEQPHPRAACAAHRCRIGHSRI